jgi:hypothetical protein
MAEENGTADEKDAAAGNNLTEEKDAAEEKTAATPKTQSIIWTASESVDHQRGKIWYLVAILVAAAIVGLAIWTKQYTMGGLAIIMLIAVIVVVRKPAREINYELSDAGLTIDGRLRPFEEFRAFGVRRDGALWQLVLIPVKRFGLAVTMFIHDDQGEQIVDALGGRLPMEDVPVDMVDKLTRRLKL